MNPAVTEEEVRAAVDTSPDGTAVPLIFQQALVVVGGLRTAAARSALDEAQTRRSELLRIEQTLTELAQLMQQVRSRPACAETSNPRPPTEEAGALRRAAGRAG